MTAARKKAIPTQAIPDLENEACERHYKELTSRNHHFVSRELQNKLKNFRILIAGCGSTGGACIEPLARLGVCHFILADNGSYELNNLNRQHAGMENIGQNKAAFHAQEVKTINPYAEVTFSPHGITPANVDEFVSKADFVFDAVDVTTRSGIEAKILLHEKCFEYKKPVLAGLDLGYLQWGCSYDYRQGRTKMLDGKASWALSARHPIASLFRLYPLSIVPAHCYDLLDDLLEGKTEFASQMGCTSDALSAVIVPAVLKYVGSKQLISGWSVDLSPYRFTLKERFFLWKRHFSVKKRVRRKIYA